MEICFNIIACSTEYPYYTTVLMGIIGFYSDTFSINSTYIKKDAKVLIFMTVKGKKYKRVGRKKLEDETKMEIFVPGKVLIEEKALDYPLGQSLYQRFQQEGIIEKIPSHNRIKSNTGKTVQEKYVAAKNTLVIGVKRGLEFQSCKPSAHYQLPLSTSCPGMCEYCYLQTTLGKRPFVRIYVNQEEILRRAKEYIQERSPEVTVFEGAATSDPLPVEPYSRALAKTITFFSQEELGRFRFVTKFTNVDSLLQLEHRGHTRFRFSLNTEHVIKRFEHHTPRLADRLAALTKVQAAGYPIGIIIAPVIIYEGWQGDYRKLIREIKLSLPENNQEITFELISHRYTSRAKSNILSLYPNTKLAMNEEERQLKYGQFGYTKYLYRKDDLKEMKDILEQEINKYFPDSKIEYFV